MKKLNRSSKKKMRSSLRVETLEQRQLLAGITGGGTEVGSNIVHSNGNVYDQVLMTGSSVSVTADSGQVTRVSFLDLSGDIVQVEFSGAGSLNVSLDSDTFKGPAEATNYNQPGVKYVTGLASFTITGSDASTNLSVFTVGSATAHRGLDNPIFAGGKLGGNNLADVQRLTIVADPSNANGSAFGGIRAGNAVFGGSSGVVGVSAANVAVQNVVVVGDVEATGTASPALNFGANSQFNTVVVAGGDLANSKLINNISTAGGYYFGGSGYYYNVLLTAGTTSGGAYLAPQTATPSFLGPVGNTTTAEQTLPNGTALSLINNTTGATFTFADTTGTADSATLSLNKVSTGEANVTIAGVETITVNSNGADANDITPNFAAAKTLIVGGATELTLSGTNAVATSITSTNTAGVTVTSGLASIIANTTAGGVTIAGGAGHDTITVSGPAGANESISGGDGNDTITFTANLANTDSISGGAGTDTFASTSALLNAYAAPAAATLSGFEILSVTNALAGTVNTSKIQAGLTTVDLPAGSATATLEVDAGSNTIQIGAANAGTLTIQTASTNTSTTDAVTINNTAAGMNVFGGQGLTVSRIETVTINGSGTGAATAQSIGALNAGTAVVNLTGSNSFTISGTTTAAELNAGGLTGTASLTMSSAAAHSSVTKITGTANADTIRDGSGAAVIIGGAGNDAIIGGGGNDNISGGDGDDTFTMGTNLSTNVTLDGGAGNDRLVVTGLSSGALTNVSNVETLAINGASGTVATAISFATVEMNDGAAQNISLDTGFSGSPTFLVDGGDKLTNNTSAAITVRATDANLATITVAGGSGVDTLEITPTSTTAVEVSLANRVTGVETITVLDAGDTYENAGFDAKITTGNYASTAEVATTLTIHGSSLDAASSPVGANGVDLHPGGRTSETLTVDAGAITNALVRVSVTGGAGDDELVGGAGNDYLDGGAGADTLTANNGNNTVIGGTGNDTITVGTGNDSIQAGGGADRITINGNLSGLDTIDGGSESDTLVVTGALTDAQLVNTSSIESLEVNNTVTLGAQGTRVGVTTITQSAAANGATDTVDLQETSNGVRVNLRGGVGTSSVLGGSGDDVIHFGGTRTIVSGAGSSTAGDMLDTTDVIAGGLGNDRIIISLANAASAGATTQAVLTIGTGKVTGIETVQLGDGKGFLPTSGTTQTVETLELTISDITLTTAQTVSITGANITDDGDKSDVINIINNVATTTGGTSFSITGGPGADTLNGGVNADTISGGKGNDIINGGAGNDSLAGGDGADELTGGTGEDMLTGNGGADNFVVTGSVGTARDTITDFVAGSDNVKIAFSTTSEVDATMKGAVTNAGDAAASFTGVLGQFVFNSANSTLLVDSAATGLGSITGDDIQVVLPNVTSLSASDVDFTITGTANAATAQRITTGAGDDTIIMAGNMGTTGALDTINGGLGTDTLTYTDGAATNQLSAVTNIETITIGNTDVASGNIAETLDNGLVAADARVTINAIAVTTATTNIDGSAEANGNLTITVGSATAGTTTGAVTLVGGAGADVLTARTNGAVTLTGGAGNDTLTHTGTGTGLLTGGSGSDSLVGGEGVDTFVYATQAELFANNVLVDSAVSGGLGDDVLRIGISTVNNGNVAAGAFTIAATDSFAGVTSVKKIVAEANAGAVSVTLGTTAETAGINVVDLASAASSTGNVINVSAFTAGTTLTGSSTGATSVTGGSGDDAITGGSANDTLMGGLGNDVFVGGAGVDSINGGDGVDTVDFTGSDADVTLTLNTSTAAILSTGGTQGADSIVNVENVIGSAYADTITGDSANNSITGAAGNDTLGGAGGNDTLTGGEGADVLTGGAGADSIVLTETSSAADEVKLSVVASTATPLAGSSDSSKVEVADALDTGADTITGFDLANDTITLTATGVVNFVHGTHTTVGTGTTTTSATGAAGEFTKLTGLIQFDSAAANSAIAIGVAGSGDVAVTFVNLVNGGAGTPISDMTGAGVEAAFEATLRYNITGDSSANTITTGGLNDTIVGGAGNDTIDGAGGSDTVDFSAATQSGGGVLQATDAGVTLTLNTSTAATLNPGVTNQGADSIVNIENVVGTAGVDTITGDSAANSITGGGGADVLRGLGGDDSISGGAGADVITGGTGSDLLSGGDDRDVFVFASDKGTGASTDSSVAAFDTVTGFGLATASWTGSSGLDEVSEFQAATVGGSGAVDILDINLAAMGGTAATLAVEADSASSVSTTATSLAETVKTAIAGAGTVTTAVTNGLLTVTSTVAADINTLDKWLAAAAAVAATDGETLAFVFDGSTYVFTQNGTQDLLVKLNGVTTATGLSLLAGSGTVGGAGRIIIG